MFLLNFSPSGQHLEFQFLIMRYMCQKTDQMGIPKIFVYNFLSSYAITIVYMLRTL